MDELKTQRTPAEKVNELERAVALLEVYPTDLLKEKIGNPQKLELYKSALNIVKSYVQGIKAEIASKSPAEASRPNQSGAVEYLDFYDKTQKTIVEAGKRRRSAGVQ